MDDINVHLPQDKLPANESDVELFQIDAHRVISGMLSNVFPPAELASWADPSDTPEYIRGIAGRLIAAKFYAVRYSEDSADEVPAYAQTLYDQAIAMLGMVISGDTVLPEVDPAISGGERFTNLDFWPNDSAPGPIFSVELET